MADPGRQSGESGGFLRQGETKSDFIGTFHGFAVQSNMMPSAVSLGFCVQNAHEKGLAGSFHIHSTFVDYNAPKEVLQWQHY